jgi:hypothetical protein
MLLLLVLGILLACYVVYYRKYAVGPPKLVCSDPERKRVLEEHCPILFQRFYPTMWAIQAHVQTVGRAVLQNYPKLKRRR